MENIWVNGQGYDRSQRENKRRSRDTGRLYMYMANDKREREKKSLIKHLTLKAIAKQKSTE
jgi:hypothetical protein